MHPPTPYPASARTKPRLRDTAFREITARANAVSRSEQDFLSVMKKEEVVTGKPSKTGTASRRYSAASKFGDPKALSSSTVAADAKPKINKRASIMGVANGPQLNGSSTQASLASGKSTAVPSSKATANRTAAPSFQETKLGSLPKRQSLAPQQANKLQKPASDLRKRLVSGHEKAESLLTNHTSKTRGLLLKSAHYWLEQVNLAEVMQKHGVSAGFFRLAVDCEAEPRELLRDELIDYIKRHSLWSDSIQQTLLCYNISTDAQNTLFSQLSANDATESSSPCTPAKRLEGVLSNERDPAHPEIESKCLDVNIEGTMPNDRVEENSIKEDTPPLQNLPLHGASGRIKSMDADTIAREVVSIIMSSMNCLDSSRNLKNDVLVEPGDKSSSGQNNLGSSSFLEVQPPMICVQESISDHNCADPDEAISTGSLPSLNVWSTKGDNAVTLDVQGEVTLGNDIRDNVSRGKLAGDEMCVSMELDVDDSTSDNQSDLQSKSPTCQGASSEESALHASQTAIEAHDDTVRCPDVNRCSGEPISAGINHDTMSRDLIYEKNSDKESAKWESGVNKEGRKEIATPKAEIEKYTAIETMCLPEVQGNRRSSSSIVGRPQNKNEKSVATSVNRKTEMPALNRDNSAASIALINSRRISISTPKSSTLASVPNSETSVRTRRKPRVSQLTKPGNESDRIDLKSPIGASEGTLTTPRQESSVAVGEAKQGSSKAMDRGAGATTDTSGSMATPGSAAVRRSARLMRQSGGITVSTSDCVSTPRVQRRLGTLMPADEEVAT